MNQETIEVQVSWKALKVRKIEVEIEMLVKNKAWDMVMENRTVVECLQANGLGCN